jgi:hypothetical protein
MKSDRTSGISTLLKENIYIREKCDPVLPMFTTLIYLRLKSLALLHFTLIYGLRISVVQVLVRSQMPTELLMPAYNVLAGETTRRWSDAI